MPAPAVIPAPKAYINAVAVKGFVVELWAVFKRDTCCPRSILSAGPVRLQPVNIRNKDRGNDTSLHHLRAQCAQEGVRVFYCD